MSSRAKRRGPSNTAGLIGAWSMEGAEENTTNLIEQWSMEGLARELDLSFGSSTDAPAVATAEQARLCGTAYDVPILVKSPEEESWLPLGGTSAVADDEDSASDVANRLISY